jgi:predicted amidophosphoribosyltransferase
MLDETDITKDNQNIGRDKMREKVLLQESDDNSADTQQADVAYKHAGSVKCPQCGAENDAEAMFCASCGEPLHKATCPNCGADIDPDADFCEKCHHYIKKDICSFCGAHLTGDEAYCPECGSPRGGIVCPVCHTLNEFAFCKQCGQPLTEDAKTRIAELQTNPEYIELIKYASQYDELDNNLPFDSERDQQLDEISNEFRKHVLALLAKSDGVEDPVIMEPKKKRLSKEEIQKQKDFLTLQLTSLFEKIKVPPMKTSVSARNYAMACKPAGLRLGWICNYKHAVHSSPCGCAKPQMGGKWIILGSNQNTKDDK